MKINIRKLPYERVMALPRPKHRNPLRPLGLLKPVIRLASLPTLLKTRFSCTRERMELVHRHFDTTTKIIQKEVRCDGHLR